ncbi:hypothetical protein [Levilactobacillus acidifarinae]|uniref:Acyltransferase 3 domain-containing protein n=1 Tax=Levilactobacillus acidifarinae DSM 19394 = JCM 15949 TaxID=1423715 RepID=A0A0R1LP83_9LACO|nr:hypothetical protein [Levilactobacillus acidifarinae]KRK94521.1 hypothetical protein FD25_GL000488 [Levilactobacillus acidifarinae DSM 19394]GEO68269.1 hypothetical protein LAC03_01790 [Levilactobacillus acidifarinae]
MKSLSQVKVTLWGVRLVYVMVLVWVIADLWRLNSDPRISGTLFFLIGFPAVYLENQREKLEPAYGETLGCTLWRFLLFPWFLVM